MDKIENWLSPKPNKRVVQSKLDARIREYYSSIPKLASGTIVSLAGANFIQATSGYNTACKRVMICERDPQVHSYISRNIQERRGDLNLFLAANSEGGPICVVDCLDGLIAQKDHICGLDLDFDDGIGSPLSKDIEWIQKKFFQQVNSPAFWLRIMIPVRAQRTSILEDFLKHAVHSQNYYLLDLASGPTFSYKDSVSMLSFQIIMKGKRP